MSLTDLFPLLYHAHHSLHPEDLPFWQELAARWGDPILELGCGTGRVLHTLAEKGHHVVGLDNDAGMLGRLQDTIQPKLKARVNIVQADISAMPFEARFNLILMPCNTLSTLSPEVRRSMWSEVRASLAPGGLFAVSLPNPQLLRRLPGETEPEIEDIFAHPVDGEPVQVSSRMERRGGEFVVTWYYDHLLPDGQVERLETQVRHHLTSRQEYLAEISSAGLEVSALYGNFERAPFTPRSPNLILLVQGAVSHTHKSG